jgi:hypothetical protein
MIKIILEEYGFNDPGMGNYYSLVPQTLMLETLYWL